MKEFTEKYRVGKRVNEAVKKSFSDTASAEHLRRGSQTNIVS